LPRTTKTVESETGGRQSGLEGLFNPRSVAIIGASNEPDRLAGLPLKFLKGAKFEGEIWPVNPNRDQVQGIKSYPSIEALPGAADVAIIVVPAALVRQAVIDCAEKGVGFAMIFTAGFGETGAGDVQVELEQIARAAGMRLLGPNCLGCFDSASRFYGTFAIALYAGFHEPGNIAMVSQSGAYGEQTCFLARERGLGVRYFISTGNEADISLGEAIDWFAGRAEVDVILAYAEGVRDAARLEQGLARAQARGKKVIFVKVGRSDSGAAAAASHTAALAGDDAVWGAVFEKYGVYRAHSTEEQVDIAYAASRGRFPAGRKVGILSLSGGFGIQLCDAAAEAGLSLPPPPQDVAQRLRELLPFGSIGNPLDASGQATAHLSQFGESLRLFVRDGGFDAVIGFFGTIPLAPAMGKPLKESVSAAIGASNRLVVLSLVGDAETVRAYEQAGFLVFPDNYRAVRAVAALAQLSGHGDREPAQTTAPPPASKPRALSEHAAKAFLAESGVPLLPEALAHSQGEAIEAARKLGFPVALKICGPTILHKSDIGGVLLSVDTEADVADGYRLLCERAHAAGFERKDVEGVLVAPMAPRGVETILGVKNDPAFGPVVLFGLGGIYSEVLKDFAVRLAPVSLEDAHRMIRSITAWPILRGARGSAPADIEALARAISDLSQFAVDNAGRISEIDINPFVVWEEGKGGVALDALVTLRPPPGEPDAV
jgi:acyl-CoA synthetase (NDP forming)